ncbi:hypothetical protein DPMN_022717 [Dreissena polymorpha]|uniref:Uncharacterized protein n=1 Tax=Dreissena polymorpha TaxID=45954 RepID=A0A9D4SAC7_DREPO|nr:hypothetical protein DPMN_022717 [Dreissena polymorpha]
MIVEIINKTKDEFLKSVEHKIEVLEGKLFEKEKENDKLREKVDRMEEQIKSKREQDQHNSANIQEFLDLHSGQMNSIGQNSRRHNVHIFGIQNLRF